MTVVSDGLPELNRQVSPPPSTEILQPQMPRGGRHGSLSRLRLSGFVSAQRKDHLVAILGALALLAFELTLRNFAQKQASVPLG